MIIKVIVFWLALIFAPVVVFALTPVATGSVTQSNWKASIIDGAAFVDFSTVNILTNYVGYKIVISDSTNKKLTGFIKAVGTGETYNEMVTNGGSEGGAIAGSSTSGLKSKSQSTEQVKTGTYSAKLIFDTATGHTLNVSAAGRLLLLNIWIYVPSAQSITGNIGVYDVVTGSWFLASTTKDAWVAVASNHYRNGTIGIGSTMGTADNKFMYIDDVSVKQVLTPSSTGVTIVSAYNGNTFNWASEDSGFKRNDSSGYTYEIYPGDVAVTISDTNTYSTQVVDCYGAGGKLGIVVTAAATIQNYTVVGCPAGGIQFDESATLKNTVVVSSGNDITIATGKTVTGTANLFNDAAKAGGGTYSNVAGTQWSATPLFKSSSDYRPRSGSPLIGAGTPISGLTTDYAGRLWKNPPSIGAYEYYRNVGGNKGFSGFNLGFGL